MSVATRFLLYLSKTDRRLIPFCSDTAYKTQASNGLFVLIVGILAFSSSSFALRNSLGARWLGFVVAAVYATLIMFIDREIVSAPSKKRGMIITRLGLAIFIGLVVSVPIELQIFDKQINQALKTIHNSNNEGYSNRKEQAEAELRERIAVQEKRVQDLVEEQGELHNRLTNEVLDPNAQIGGVRAGTGRPGEGPVFRRLQQQIQEQSTQLDQARADLVKTRADAAQEQKRIDDEFIEKKVPPADDLLSRYVALGAVKRDPVQGSDAWFMAWGVRLLLIMLELTPALIKLLQDENEYDVLLQASRRLGMTRVFAIANDHMEQLAQNGGQNPRPTMIEQLKAEPLMS